MPVPTRSWLVYGRDDAETGRRSVAALLPPAKLIESSPPARSKSLRGGEALLGYNGKKQGPQAFGRRSRRARPPALVPKAQAQPEGLPTMVPSSEALYERLFEFGPNAVVVVNRGGRLALANRQAEWVFGYARGELVGRPVEILAPERFRAAYAELLACGRSRLDTPWLPHTRNLAGLRKDGSEFPVEITLGPAEAAEGTLVLAFRDVSEQKQAQQELQARARQQAAVSELGRRALTGIDLPQLMAEAAALVRRGPGGGVRQRPGASARREGHVPGGGGLGGGVGGPSNVRSRGRHPGRPGAPQPDAGDRGGSPHRRAFPGRLPAPRPRRRQQPERPPLRPRPAVRRAGRPLDPAPAVPARGRCASFSRSPTSSPRPWSGTGTSSGSASGICCAPSR